MPAISVIVPVYNVEPYLRRCVDSILAQTYTDFELILVDDGSPDNCGAICDEYAAKDNRVRVIHKENGGVSSARNIGVDWAFANSDSEWLYFVDSDDWIHPECLKIMLHAVTESQLNLAVAEYARVKQPSEKVPSVFSEYQIESPVSVYTKNFTFIDAYPWTKLFAKHLWHGVRFPLGKRYEDLAVIYKVMLPEKSVAHVAQTLYYYFVSPHSQENDSREDYYWALEQHYKNPLVTENKRLLSFILMVDVKVCCHDCARIVSSKKLSLQEKRKYFRGQMHRAFAIILHRWPDITKEDKKRFVRDLFVSLRSRVGRFVRH